MWHQSVNCNFMKPREYFLRKENKNNDFIPHFHLYCFSAHGGTSTDPDPAWWRWTHVAPPHACVMYCTSTRETVETKMWNKIFIFVFFAQKVFSWLHKITVDRLMSHGLLCRSSWYFSRPWSCKDPCCLWRVRELSDSNKNILICVPKMNGGLTGLEQHQGE